MDLRRFPGGGPPPPGPGASGKPTATAKDVPPFLTKLEEMLANADNSPAIEWSAAGDTIIVKNVRP